MCKYDVPDDLPELGPDLVATLPGLQMSLCLSSCMLASCVLYKLLSSHTTWTVNVTVIRIVHLDVDDFPHGCVALRTVWSAGVDWTQRSVGRAPLQEERALSGALLTWQSPENLAESRKTWQSPEKTL